MLRSDPTRRQQAVSSVSLRGEWVFLFLPIFVLIMPLFFLYAAHIYVTVLTRSSSGEDRMHWPSETYTDWFGEGALVLGIGLTWSSLALIPSGMAFHEISPRWGLATWLAL